MFEMSCKWDLKTSKKSEEKPPHGVFRARRTFETCEHEMFGVSQRLQRKLSLVLDV